MTSRRSLRTTSCLEDPEPLEPLAFDEPDETANGVCEAPREPAGRRRRSCVVSLLLVVTSWPESRLTSGPPAAGPNVAAAEDVAGEATAVVVPHPPSSIPAAPPSTSLTIHVRTSPLA